MQVHLDTNIYHSELEELEKLYERSFPAVERRPWESIIRPSAPGCPRLLAVRTEGTGELLGMATVWHFPGFMYLEHFAINETNRGSGIGTEVLTALKASESSSDQPVPWIVEVEPAHNPDSTEARRIAFYERNGFFMLDYPYIQPPYVPGMPEIGMLLMSTDPGIDPAEVAATLHINVYNKKL